MKIFIDFDDVMFNNKKFIADLDNIYFRNDILKSQLKEYKKSISDSSESEKKPYSPDNAVAFLKK